MSKWGIDLFCGAGGLSLGAKSVGIQVLCAVEKDASAAKTYKENFPETSVICDDIRSLRPTELELPDDIFIVFGGPPCQGFSTSNMKTRTLTNPNNYLFLGFVDFVKELSPEWFVLENVEGLVSFQGGRVLSYIISSFEDIGYTVSYRVVQASDFGVPQKRKRFILVGNKSGIYFSFPENTLETVSVGEAINDLPLLKNGQMSDSLPYRLSWLDSSSYAKRMRKGSEEAKQNYVSKNADYVIERYKHIGPGQNWEAIPDSLMGNYKNLRNCHSGIYKRLKTDQPSVVISNYRKSMLIHPFQDRGLSVREAARLQSFPDTFLFSGSLMQMQQQIGNAVPPLLAEGIFKEIVEF